MKDHIPNWRDDQRLRKRAASIHHLNAEPSNGKRPPSWRRRALTGVALGAMGYLITSCFFEQRLHKPKIQRDQFRFRHAPPD